jgi:hypothetical protein
MLAFHCICMVLYSEKTFSHVFGPRSGAERLNAKISGMKTKMPYWKRLLVVGEKVLIMMRKHDLVMHLGMDHPHHPHHQKRMAAIKSSIVSSHRN